MLTPLKILFPLLAIAAAPATGQTWRVAGGSGAAPDRAVYLVDTASIRRTGSIVQFRTQTVFERFSADRGWDRSVTDREADCSKRSSAVVRNRLYAGNALHLDDKARQGDLVLSKGSILGRVLSLACGDGSYETDVVKDPIAAARTWLDAH